MSIEGVYELEDVEKGEVKLTIKSEGEGKWRVQAKVANNMSNMVTEEDGVFTPGPVMSTRMMPPPELQELERKISDLLSGLNKIYKDGEDDAFVDNSNDNVAGDVLVIEGEGSSERFKTASE